MGIYRKNGEVNWTALTIWGTSFLRFVLKDKGYTLDSGFVFVMDSQRVARQFINEYNAKFKNGEFIKRWSSRSQCPANYCCGIMAYQKDMKEEAVHSFLTEQDFLPILVVSGGILPDFLKIDFNIFRIGEDEVLDLKDKNTQILLGGFQEYIIENVDEVCAVIERVESSKAIIEFDGPDEMFNLFINLVAVLSVYTTYFRKSKTEIEVEEISRKFLQESKHRIFQMLEFSSGENLVETFSQLLWRYAEENEWLKIADISMVDGDTYLALRKNRAILYDYNYYYLPPELFRDICQPLLETTSIPEVKRQLKSEGILYSNSLDYTVKKQVITAFGTVERPRFLWICKEELLLPDNLYLEEVFGNSVQTKEDVSCLTQLI